MRRHKVGWVDHGSRYSGAIIARGWQDTKRTVREHVRSEGLITLAVVVVAYALQGDSDEQAALNAALITVIALAGLVVVTCI